MDRDLIIKFMDMHNYDVRATGNGRWIDQKCTHDTVCFVADCIVEYIDQGGKQPFFSPQIWKSDYAVVAVQKWFGKPDPLTESTLDEYNKFFRQPLKMLAAAGVLTENNVGSKIEFQVANAEILEYIALKDNNSFVFLCLYIKKTLRDSGLWSSFQSFFDNQTKTSFEQLKTDFSALCVNYTPINTETEANRIFTKVLNPLAFQLGKRGTLKGRLSPTSITPDKILYNQSNWRDIKSGKAKNVARSDFTPSMITPLYEYKVTKAKNNLRRFNIKYNGGGSEVSDEHAVQLAAHMHHIFPKNEFRTIADYVENLIALTAGQHLDHAHPKGNTTLIDPGYQYTCLMHKTESIRKNLVESYGVSGFYNFFDYMFVLDTGLDSEHFQNLPLNDFSSVVEGIESHHESPLLEPLQSQLAAPVPGPVSNKLLLIFGLLLLVLWSFWYLQ